MFKNIKNIMYEKIMLSSAEYFQIEIHEDKNVLKFIDNKYEETIKNPRVENVNDELVMQYFNKLFRIIDGWENKYENNNVVDGIEWQLKIIYKNGEIKHYLGKNDFPSNFEYLDKIKYEIIDKMMESRV